MCLQNLYLLNPGLLHVYSGAVKKDHLTLKDYYVRTCVLYNFVINLYANLSVSSLTCKYL